MTDMNQGWNSVRETRPGNPSAAYTRIRATHAEREDVVARLQEAFADGRLEQHELDARLQAALSSRTRGELTPLLADLYPPVQEPASIATPTVGDRMIGLASHLLGFGTSFIGPLVLLLTVGRRSPFVRSHATTAVNFQVTFVLATVALPAAAAVTIGLAVLPYLLLALGWVVLPIVAAVASAGGSDFRYPFTLRLLR